MRKTPSKKPKTATRLVQFTMSSVEFRQMCAAAKRADLSQAALIRCAIKTHLSVEAELAAKLAADKAEAERRLIERSRSASPDSFVAPRLVSGIV